MADHDASLDPGANYAPIAIAPLSILFGISCLICAGRIHSRTRPQWRVRSEDYTIFLAQITVVVWYSLTMTLYARGRGRENYPLVREYRSSNAKIYAVASLIYLWALNTVRISMCLMLLRLKDSKSWRWPLWSLIALQVALLLVATSMRFTYCRPVSVAMGEMVPDAQCITPSRMLIYGCIWNVFNILSDLFLSLMPLTFICGMKRRKSEKILIGCLMAAGLLASAASIVKLATVMDLSEASSPAGDVKVDVVYGIEMIIGAIAASLPSLKAPTHQLLRSWGVVSERGTASLESFLYRLSDGGHAVRQLRGMHLPDFSGPDAIPVWSTQEAPLASEGCPAISESKRTTDLKRLSMAKTRDTV